jgi:thiol-disulfide isomerase/thioredoxin
MKNRFPIFTFLMIITFLPGFSQNRSITFIEKPWPELVTQAKAENKMIFLDAYASWCGPCKWMAANMFTNDTIADYYNSTFICVHMDMEKGEGIQLARTFQIRAYPTLLFISPDGEMVHKRVGAPQRTQDYLDMGKIALTPGEGFGAYVKKYNEGNCDPDFILKYLERLKDAYMPVDLTLKEYFWSQSETDLLSRTNWEIIYKFVTEMDSPEFGNLLKYQQEYEKLYSKDSVNSKIYSVYLQALTAMTRSKSFNEEKYNALKQKIRESGFADADKLIFTADLSSRIDDKFFELAYNGIDKYYSDDYDKLYRIAKAFLTNTEDQKYLVKAVEWAKKSIELKSTAENNDTYAGLMFKMGNKEEAVKYEKIALELANREKLILKVYEDNLKKYQEE